MDVLMAAVVAVSTGIGAAEGRQSMEERLQKKLREPFLSKAPWITDYDKAREESRKTGKLIFAYFTRSYAECPFCTMAEKGVLSKDEFAEFAKDYVLFCHVTARIPGRKYDDLLSEKGGQGFPHFAAMDAEGEVLAAHDGPREVEGFRKTMEKAAAFVEDRKRAAAGDREAKFRVLVHRLEMGSVGIEEARRGAKEAGPLTAEQEARIQSLLTGAEVREVLKTVTPERESRLEAGRRFLEMKKSGRPAPVGDQEIQAYWILMMDYAESRKDAATFREALGALKAKFGENPQARRFFKAKEETLRGMEEKK